MPINFVLPSLPASGSQLDVFRVFLRRPSPHVEFAQLRDLVDDTEPGPGASVHLQQSDGELNLTGTLSLYPRSGEDAVAGDGFLALTFDIDTFSDPDPPSTHERWPDAIEQAAKVLGVESFNISRRQICSVDEFDAAIPLPLPFDTRGFDEIAGVRLAKNADSEADPPLYSAILDRHSDQYFLSVMTTIRASISPGLLVDAWERLDAIASLALTAKEPSS